jgi:hypothetical protein
MSPDLLRELAGGALILVLIVLWIKQRRATRGDDVEHYRDEHYRDENW